jgi:hypothetical protein
MKKERGCKDMKSGASGGAFYGFGFLGALIYYIQTAQSFGEGVLGVLKAIVGRCFLFLKSLRF